MAQPYQEILKKYLSEVIAIFLGISISFWFDEWRDERKDREMEHKVLQNLKENLLQDTFLLGQTIQGVRSLVYGTEKLALFKQDADIADSVSFYIDMAASYTGFLNNQTTYEEMKQAGHARLIQDDTLKKSILGYYTSLMPYVQEWCEVDKTHTMTQLIPEMSNYFPVVIDTTGMAPAATKIQALKKPKLRNLLITNLVYKKEAFKALKMANIATKRLVARIDKVLIK
jgi:hypothetical protein